MERDALVAHGMSVFLKERLMDDSDAYTVHVCDICGLFAQRALRKENIISAKRQPTDADIYHCEKCQNYSNISKVMIPYAFKLLIQELLAMNIAARIVTKKPEVDYRKNN